jgi:glycerate dehydrogenase
MRAAFLDFNTLGPDDVEIAPLIAQLPELELYSHTPVDLVAERIADAEVVLINKVQLTAEVLSRASRLQLICLAATGSDNVDLKMARERGIAVCNIRNYCTSSVVQHVFALVLALTNHLREYHELLASRAWADSPQFCLLNFPIRELDQATFGIIGLGALGRGVANVAGAFGMQVIAAARPYELDAVPNAHTAEGDIERASFKDVLARSDVLSLHCPLTPETENLIDAKALSAMRNDAILINTARGGLVDSAALETALRDGQIAGAGIDVLRQEPPVDPDPIANANLANLIVTPHIAWAARESRQNAIDEMAANINSYFNGESRNRIV